MAQPNSAQEVFRIPEICGLIFDYLTFEEIFRLQNLTKGCRIQILEYKVWQSSIFHKDAIRSYTVKPMIVPNRPKTVEWFLTSGPATGQALSSAQEQEQGRDPGERQAESSHARFGLGASVPRSPAHVSRDYQMSDVKLNWLLIQKFPTFSYYPTSNMLGFEEDVPIGDYFMNQQASYRPLLLMDPPVSEITVMDCQGKCFEVTNAAGVTMGDVMDSYLLEALR